jgi:hypothetical protein
MNMLAHSEDHNCSTVASRGTWLAWLAARGIVASHDPTLQQHGISSESKIALTSDPNIPFDAAGAACHEDLLQ